MKVCYFCVFMAGENAKAFIVPIMHDPQHLGRASFLQIFSEQAHEPHNIKYFTSFQFTEPATTMDLSTL